MPWRIERTLSDVGRVTNEDSWAVSGSLAAVLDGTGLGDEPRFHGFATDAAWLVAECRSWLQTTATNPSTGSVCLAELAQHLIEAFGEPDQTEPSGGPSTCLSLGELIERNGAFATLHLTTVADTVALVPLPGGAIRAISDDRVAPFEALVFAAMRLERRRGTELGEAARAHVRANRGAVNRVDGYAVVSPSRPWSHLVRHDRLVMDATRPLVLMTDGFSRLFDTFKVMTAAELHAACTAGEAVALLEKLRALERGDPFAERYPRFKIHDDATLVVVTAE